MSSTSEGTSTTHTTSLLSANGGNLNLTANNGTVTVQGADLLAQGKVIVKAQDVDLQAITDTSTSSSQTQTSSFTVGAALAGTVGSKVSCPLARQAVGIKLQPRFLQGERHLLAQTAPGLYFFTPDLLAF